MSRSSALQSINLEEIWQKFITTQLIPEETTVLKIAPLEMEIDARRNKQIILDHQLLYKLQARNHNLIDASRQVVTDISSLLDADEYVAVVDNHGYTLLAENLNEGIQWPGIQIKNDRLLKARQNKILLSLKNHVTSENCPEGCYYSVCFTIFDINNNCVGALAVGSYRGPLPNHLVLSVYLGAYLIEMRYRHLQSLNYYSSQLLDQVPECAIVVNEYGAIVNTNQALLSMVSTDCRDDIIGKPLTSLTTSNLNPIHSSQEMEPHFDLYIEGNVFPCITVSQKVLVKPYDSCEHILLFRRDNSPLPAFSKSQPKAENSCPEQQAFHKLIGQSAELKRIIALGKKVAAMPFSVLIEGESGTGKELLAEAIHLESGRKGPFVPINCAAIPKELLQSELFGYESGTFTGGKKGGNIGKFEIADGGTIFLDEIGEMPADMQVSLLRFLEDRIVTRLGGFSIKKVDVRIIAATNRDLLTEVAQERFRTDLFYRLNAINIKMPPLRYRKNDIPLLATHFLNKLGEELNIQVPEIDDEVLSMLQDYDWPGNCRELQNVIQSALVYSTTQRVTLDTMKLFFRMAPTKLVKKTSLQAIEKEAILNRLTEYNGNISKAAKSLNIDRSTLYRKLKEFETS